MSRGRIPSLNWLRVFEAAARTESFVRAAEVLNMSPPAVSQQVRALETHLGRALFERGAKNVVLTDAGRSFLPVVQQSLYSVETTAAALFGNADFEQVTVQAVSLLAMGWLGSRIADFEKRHSGIRINLNTGNLVSDFRNTLPGRDADLQIAFGSSTDFPANAERLFGETLSITGAPQIVRSIKDPAQLVQQTLNEVATHRSGWHQLLAANTGIDVSACRFRMVDNTPLAFMLAAAGDGLALARSPASGELERRLGLVRCVLGGSVTGNQHYFLITPQGRPLSRAAQKFRDWLMETISRESSN